MDLKEYIKSTITQISEAVEELNAELQNGTVVNPTPISGQDNVKTSQIIEYGNKRHPVTEIDFKILTNVSDSQEHGGKVNVAAGIIGMGGRKVSSEANEDESTISFSLSVCLPTKAFR